MNFVSPFDAMCWDFFPWILELSFKSEVEHLPKCISLQRVMILDLASLWNFPPLHGITIHAFVIFDFSFAFASSPAQDLSLEGSVFLEWYLCYLPSTILILHYSCLEGNDEGSSFKAGIKDRCGLGEGGSYRWNQRQHGFRQCLTRWEIIYIKIT